jgi:hypothetical protein
MVKEGEYGTNTVSHVYKWKNDICSKYSRNGVGEMKEK